MELSSLSRNIVTVAFERDGETAELSVNIDAFTPQFFREVGRRFQGKLNQIESEGKKKKSKIKEDFFEREAQGLETAREMHAELLTSGVLVGWTITENELPLAPSKEVLVKLPPRLVQELWDLCLNAAKTVKKRVDEEAGETSESTHNGSMALRVVGQNG